MAVEYTNSAAQTVAAGQNIVFTETPVKCSRGYVVHREGSGVVTLRGITNQCRARYLVSFGCNVALADGATLTPVSVAIAVNGEPLAATTMIVTPAATGNFFNVSRETFIDVPCGCCYTVSIQNTTASTEIMVENANIVIERVA